MSEFTNNAGTIYIEKNESEDDQPYEVWFEDFCILGTGKSEIGALHDASQHLASISELVAEAIAANASYQSSGASGD